jgi:hypothetical protein
MSIATLERLEAAHEDLIGALDASDFDAIERGIEELREAVASARGVGAWRQGHQVQQQAERIMKLGEAARIRVNYLTDLTQQRLHMLATARGEALVPSYAARRSR